MRPLRVGKTRSFIFWALSAVLCTVEAWSADHCDLAITHVNVLPMDTERVLPDQTVTVVNKTIVKIEPTKRDPPSRCRSVVSGRNRYLAPGLADMHAHIYYPTDFAFYLANGVTTVRNMQGHPPHLQWRRLLRNGGLIGPSMTTAGPTIWNAKTAEAGERAVRNQIQAGYDFVKVYNNVGPDGLTAIVRTADELHVYVAGHIPNAVGIAGVLEEKRRLRSIEHAEELLRHWRPGTTVPLDESKFEADDRDVAALATVSQQVRDAGVWVVPTLVTFHNVIRQVEDLPSALQQPGIKKLAPWVQDLWGPANSFYASTFSPADLSGFKHSWEFQKRITSELHQRGVKLMVGTDAMVPGNVPGYTVHEELQNFVDVGLTPFEALRATTTSPATFLDPQRKGTLEVGGRADLVLFANNPLSAIANTRQVEGVVLGGRWYSAATLKSLEESAIDTNQRTGQKVRRLLTADPKEAVRILATFDGMGQLFKYEAFRLLRVGDTTHFRRAFLLVRALEPDGDIAQEWMLNSWGYELLQKKQYEAAIGAFEMNVELFPKSANAYDSLAEAFMKKGDPERAIENYQKVLTIDPQNRNAIEQLRVLTKSNRGPS